MDRLDSLRAFAIAVDSGSLSAAARALRRSSASITRAIDSLEERLGAKLLKRTTRSLKLTDAGERYLGVVRRVLGDLDEAEQMTGESLSEPRGLLTVTAPIAFGSLHVRPVVGDFLETHPSVRAKLLLLDRLVNLVEEGVDVAVRVGELPDSTLIATSVGNVRRIVVASPQYLARCGRPRSPSDLAAHRCIASTAVTPHDSWSFGGRAGARKKRVKIDPILSVNVAETAIGAALSGTGITCALSYQVAAHLERGELVRILQSFELPAMPVHLVRPPALARTAKVREFVEFAAGRLREVLA